VPHFGRGWRAAVIAGEKEGIASSLIREKAKERVGSVCNGKNTNLGRFVEGGGKKKKMERLPISMLGRKKGGIRLYSRLLKRTVLFCFGRKNGGWEKKKNVQ